MGKQSRFTDVNATISKIFCMKTVNTYAVELMVADAAWNLGIMKGIWLPDRRIVKVIDLTAHFE